jgi:cell division transport system ATP-binding protein
MATHEAGFVDEMKRRVIELHRGSLVRDERHGGYGDTSSLPSLAPGPERGAASVAALTAVLEVHRETVASAGTEPDTTPSRDALSPSRDGAAIAREASAEDAPRADALPPVTRPPARPPRPAETDEGATTTSTGAGARAASAGLDDMRVDELGLADRLGLDDDGDDEVGPTR